MLEVFMWFFRIRRRHENWVMRMLFGKRRKP
jgi:hypothetical protein